MIPYGAEVRVLATRARIRDRDGEATVVIDLDAHTIPDFALVLTSQQARDLANKLMHPEHPDDGRMLVRPVRWLRRITRRGW